MQATNNHITTIIITAVAVALLFTGILFFYKPPHPLPQPDDLQQTPLTIKGIVSEYGSNADRDIDKLLVTNDDEQRWLHFAPHTARSILSVARLQAPVEASVRDGRKPGPDDIIQQELLSVTNTKTGKTFSLHDVPPPPPAEGKETEISGSILDYRKDKKGNRIRSIIIGRHLVLLPPHATESLLPLLTEHKNIMVKGWERSQESGFVNEDSLTLIRPYAIIINGTQYLIQ